MKTAKEYQFKSKLLVLEILFLAISLLPMVSVVAILFRNPVIMVIVCVLPFALFYLQFYTVCITLQFNKYDQGKKVYINDDRSTLTMVKGDITFIINETDVERVEVYEQNSLGKFGTYNYIVIYTVDDRKLLITKFTVPLLVYDKILEKFLKKKPRVYFKKNFNYIDESKFKI